LKNIFEFASHDDVRAALNEILRRFPYMNVLHQSHAAQGPVLVGLVEIGHHHGLVSDSYLTSNQHTLKCSKHSQLSKLVTAWK